MTPRVSSRREHRDQHGRHGAAGERAEDAVVAALAGQGELARMIRYDGEQDPAAVDERGRATRERVAASIASVSRMA